MEEAIDAKPLDCMVDEQSDSLEHSI